MLAGCDRDEFQYVPVSADDPTVTKSLTTDTPNQSPTIFPNTYSFEENVSEPIQEEQDNKLYQISGFLDGYISHIFWSKDSSVVFFWVNAELWGYELSTSTTQKMSPSHIWMAKYPTQSPTPPPKITLKDLPGIVEVMTASPSGQKALVFNSSTPKPTPRPNAGEVIGAFLDNTDVWLWDQGDMYKLGTIDVCGPNTYNWTTDENYVAIQAPLAPAPCSSNGWIINTISKEIHDILPVDVYGGVSEFGGFSPDQNYILLIHRNRDDNGAFVGMYLMDLESLRVTILDVPRITYPVSWIDLDQILVSYAEQLGDNQRPAIFNIQTGVLTDLLNPALFENIQIDPISLSPNKKWMALAVEETSLVKSSLWLLLLQD